MSDTEMPASLITDWNGWRVRSSRILGDALEFGTGQLLVEEQRVLVRVER